MRRNVDLSRSDLGKEIINMNQRYKTLLSPVRIGNHIIKNRMLYPNASPHVLQGPETFPAVGYRTFHADLARNGAAIVTIAEWNDPDQHKGPHTLDFTHMQSFDLTDPSTHNYFSLMAEEIHFYGSKLLVNTSLSMPEGYSLYDGMSAAPGRPPMPVKALPRERIPEVIDAFVEKMRMYKNLGYDGMTMRCDMEILPKSATRDDEYASDTMENRSRLIREVYAAVKKAFGGDFITEAIVAWEQPHGYGSAIGAGCSADDVAEFCHLIDKDVDIFQIREHDGCRSHPTGFNFQFGDHPAVDFCARLKKEGIHALLEPIGGFQEPDEMERYLNEGKCDMFGMARAFMADPEYGVKMAEGRGEDITPCLKCNKCHGTVLDDPDPWIAFCSVNPRHGLGHELDRLVRATTPKKVAVIGGGAAGMRAAVIAAERGHDVTLYEKTGVLGGQLLHADYFEFKWPIKNYKNWLIRELGQKGVKIVMNCAPTPEKIEAGGYDAVLAATGAVASVPRNIEGVYDENGKQLYPTCWDVWDKEEQLGKHVVIVGGSETGMEMAIHLLRRGHKVTMLTRQDKVAHNASRLHYITMAFVKVEEDGKAWEAPEWERYEDFTGIVSVTTKSIRDNVVTYVDADGAEHTVEADSVVLCGGVKRLTDEAMAYAGVSQQFYPIGDCIGAGNIQRCNRQAFARASIL